MRVLLWCKREEGVQRWLAYQVGIQARRTAGCGGAATAAKEVREAVATKEAVEATEAAEAKEAAAAVAAARTSASLAGGSALSLARAMRLHTATATSVSAFPIRNLNQRSELVNL